MVIKGKMIIIINQQRTFTQLFLLLRSPWRCLWASATAVLCVSLRNLDYQAGHNGWVSTGCSCILPYFCKISSLWQCCTHSGGWLQQNSRSHPWMISRHETTDHRLAADVSSFDAQADLLPMDKTGWEVVKDAWSRARQTLNRWCPVSSRFIAKLVDITPMHNLSL